MRHSCVVIWGRKIQICCHCDVKRFRLIQFHWIKSRSYWIGKCVFFIGILRQQEGNRYLPNEIVPCDREIESREISRCAHAWTETKSNPKCEATSCYVLLACDGSKFNSVGLASINAHGARRIRLGFMVDMEKANFFNSLTLLLQPWPLAGKPRFPYLPAD